MGALLMQRCIPVDRRCLGNIEVNMGAADAFRIQDFAMRNDLHEIKWDFF